MLLANGWKSWKLLDGIGDQTIPERRNMTLIVAYQRTAVVFFTLELLLIGVLCFKWFVIDRILGE